MTKNAASADRTLVRLVLLVLAVLVLAPILAMSFAAPMMGTMGWWGHDGGMVAVAPWWGLGMGLGWLAVLALVGYVVYRALVRGGEVGTEADPAMEALRLAYARGELTDEEFESRRTTLTDDLPDEV